MILSHLNIVRTGQSLYLNVKSQKTGIETTLKLPQYAIEILERYDGISKTLLPAFSNAYFNLQLKQLGKLIFEDVVLIKHRMRRNRPVVVYKDGNQHQHFLLADHLTTHTMRRTAITTMLRLGMPEQSVRKISGHTPQSKDFYKYIAYSQHYIDNETDRVFEKLLKH